MPRSRSYSRSRSRSASRSASRSRSRSASKSRRSRSRSESRSRSASKDRGDERNVELPMCSKHGRARSEDLYSVQVENVSPRTSKVAVFLKFQKFGEVGDVWFPPDRSGRDPEAHKGFGFIRFFKKADMEDALDAFESKGLKMDGNEIRVMKARPRPAQRDRYDRRSPPRNRYRSRSPPRRRRSRSRSRDRRHR